MKKKVLTKKFESFLTIWKNMIYFNNSSFDTDKDLPINSSEIFKEKE